MKSTKLISILLIFLSMNQIVLAAQLPKSKINSKGAVLIEQDSKRILYQKDAEKQLPMASTTKIMTCLIALEKGNLDDIVTVSKRAARAPKVKLNLMTGEKQRLGDLLYSLMLESHNDTAVAIAEHIGGSVEEFCVMMTKRAHELGANNTSFQTPSGLDAESHYTTAYDLALIAAYALANPKLVEIMNTQSITIPTKPTEGSKQHSLQNKNRFLYTYNGANGMKTGFTSKAGHCFVGSAKKDDMQLIGVALAAGWGQNGRSQKYKDVITLMNYGFENYKKYVVLEPSQGMHEVKVKEGKEDYLALDCKAKITLPLTKKEKEEIVLKNTAPIEVEAPIIKGDVIGRVDIVCDNVVLGHAHLVAANDIERANLIDKIKKFFTKKSR